MSGQHEGTGDRRAREGGDAWLGASPVSARWERRGQGRATPVPPKERPWLQEGYCGPAARPAAKLVVWSEVPVVPSTTTAGMAVATGEGASDVILVAEVVVASSFVIIPALGAAGATRSSGKKLQHGVAPWERTQHTRTR